MSREELIEFEAEVARRFEAGEICGPVHLCGGNEDALLNHYTAIGRDDWVFATYRNHYHALLHGIPREKVMEGIVAGHSMNLTFPEYRFYSSAIVAGCLPIAVGVAWAVKQRGEKRYVHCFLGDMAATTGAFHEAQKYASGHRLPIRFIIEDNGLSCETPTQECWGDTAAPWPSNTQRHKYTRIYPHVGIGKYIKF